MLAIQDTLDGKRRQDEGHEGVFESSARMQGKGGSYNEQDGDHRRQPW